MFGILLLGCSLFLCSILCGCGPEKLADGPAPDFQVRDLHDRSTLTKKQLLGHPVVLDFWATWCAPCRAAMPSMQQLHNDYAKNGVRVLGITSEDENEVAPFVRDRSLTYSIGLDPGKATARQFGVDEFPTVIILDGNGNIIFREAGPRIEEIREILDRMIKS